MLDSHALPVHVLSASCKIISYVRFHQSVHHCTVESVDYVMSNAVSSRMSVYLSMNQLTMFQITVLLFQYGYCSQGLCNLGVNFFFWLITLTTSSIALRSSLLTANTVRI